MLAPLGNYLYLDAHAFDLMFICLAKSETYLLPNNRVTRTSIQTLDTVCQVLKGPAYK